MKLGMAKKLALQNESKKKKKLVLAKEVDDLIVIR
jgi:hypothetical protein